MRENTDIKSVAFNVPTYFFGYDTNKVVNKIVVNEGRFDVKAVVL